MQQRINKTEMSAPGSLAIFAISTVLLLALSGFGEYAYASPTSIPTTEQLRQVIVAHYRAIEDNQLNQAMRYYHSQSPNKVRVRENIELGLSQFLLKTTTIKFYYDGQEGAFAIATAKHKYHRISGIKFMEQFVDVIYQLREEQGIWKIWSQREGSNDEPNGLQKLKP
jgi:hypothetical protein